MSFLTCLSVCLVMSIFSCVINSLLLLADDLDVVKLLI